MDASVPLTEAMIRRLATPQSFQRGHEYYEQGAVLSVTRRGDELLAEVEGSDAEPYQVRVILADGEIGEASCDCPYDWGGVCKHIVAALLTYLYAPQEATEQPTVDALLTGMDATQLHSLVVRLAQRRPELADLIESEALAVQAYAGVKGGVASPPDKVPGTAPTATAPALPPPPNPELIRRQVRSALRSLRRGRRYEDHGYVDSLDVRSQLEPCLDQATAFVDAGDGESALAILEALTDESISDLAEMAQWSDDTLTFGDDLGVVWTEAVLSTELTATERQAWAKRLADWQAEVGDYCSTGFAAARGAAEYGWDYPPLQRVLQGEITNRGAWEGEAPDYADELAVARLNILERQGRTQEYLYLAEAESQTELYLTMLVKLGRIPEAVEYSLRCLGTAEEAMTVAEALHTQGAREEALQVAEHGMGLPGYAQTRLARWLRDEASALGQTERALAAARTLFREHPSLGDYQAIEKLVGERWPALREELLDEMRERGSVTQQAQIEILLHEGRVADAIALVDPNDYYAVVEPVVDAALESHPDWAISACKTQAERIMNAGKSNNYPYAADWLEKARTAYVATGRKTEWLEYLDRILALHRRKYSLVPLLERIRR